MCFYHRYVCVPLDLLTFFYHNCSLFITLFLCKLSTLVNEDSCVFSCVNESECMKKSNLLFATELVKKQKLKLLCWSVLKQ